MTTLKIGLMGFSNVEHTLVKSVVKLSRMRAKTSGGYCFDIVENFDIDNDSSVDIYIVDADSHDNVIVRQWMQEKCPSAILIWVNEGGEADAEMGEFVMQRRNLSSMLLRILEKVAKTAASVQKMRQTALSPDRVQGPLAGKAQLQRGERHVQALPRIG